MRRLVFAITLAVFVMPVPVSATELPKCRNVAGYEPKATCEARNQRAQWQAEYTASLTAQLVAQAMAKQAAEAAAQQGEGSFMGMVQEVYESAVKTVSGFFN